MSTVGNYNTKNIIVLQELQGNEVTHLKGIQQYLKPFVLEIIIFWWLLWSITLLIILNILFKSIIKKYAKNAK